MARFAYLPLAVVATLAIAGAAQAHPRLLSSTPADKASVPPTARIELHFSEPLEAKFSGGDLAITSMLMNGQMTNMSMKVGALAVAADPADPKTLVLTAKTALAPGGYRLDWHAVSTDTHRTQGALTFTVQ
jgi:methionine-rich copper-binding protein CopC